MKNRLFNLLIYNIILLFLLGCSTTRESYYYKDPDKAQLKRYIVVSDTHFFGPHGLNGMRIEDSPDTYYTGDIYDLKNADENEVNKVEDAIKNLRDRVGNRYIRGNHELYAFGKGEKDEDYYVTDNGIMFTHGHYKICYDIEKVKEWESKEAGTGYVKRNGRKILEEIIKKPDRPREKYIHNAVNMVKNHNRKHPDNKCHTIVFGHTHVEDVFSETVDGIRVINIPMGITYLDL